MIRIISTLIVSTFALTLVSCGCKRPLVVPKLKPLPEFREIVPTPGETTEAPVVHKEK